MTFTKREMAWLLVGSLAFIVMAVFAIARPIQIPPVHHAKPTVAFGYTLGANGTQVPIGGER